MKRDGRRIFCRMGHSLILVSHMIFHYLKTRDILRPTKTRRWRKRERRNLLKGSIDIWLLLKFQHHAETINLFMSNYTSQSLLFFCSFSHSCTLFPFGFYHFLLFKDKKRGIRKKNVYMHPYGKRDFIFFISLFFPQRKEVKEKMNWKDSNEFMYVFSRFKIQSWDNFHWK